jgi:hypothetical protein
MARLDLALVASLIASGRMAPAAQLPKGGTDGSNPNHARDRAGEVEGG